MVALLAKVGNVGIHGGPNFVLAQLVSPILIHDGMAVLTIVVFQGRLTQLGGHVDAFAKHVHFQVAMTVVIIISIIILVVVIT